MGRTVMGNPAATRASRPVRAAVVIPPLRDFYFTPHRFASLGARIACDILKKLGVDTLLHSLPTDKTRGLHAALPSELDYLKEFIVENETGRASYFTRYHFFGPPLEDCVARVESTGPDICFVSLFAYCYGDDAIEFASALKTCLPRCTVVLAGAGVSPYPQYFARRESVDFVLCGEAETNLADFVGQYRAPSPDFSKVRGCIWKERGKIRAAEPPGTVAAEGMHAAWAVPVQGRKLAQVSLCLSRGCPRRCRFCTVRLSHGTGFRPLAVQSVRRLAEDISRSGAVRGEELNFNIEDDNVLADPAYLFEALGVFRRLFPECSFSMENGIDYLFLTPSLVDRLAELGMRSFNLSLGSSRCDVLAGENRQIDLEHYKKLLDRIARHHGLPVITYFICGLEADTAETVAATLAFLASQPTRIGISPFYAVPGMEGFENRAAFNSLSTRLSTGSAAYPWYPGGLSTSTIVTAFRLSRLINLRTDTRKNPVEDELVARVNTTQAIHTIIRTPSGPSIQPVQGLDDVLIGKFFAKKPVL